jgi:hypothetical protein
MKKITLQVPYHFLSLLMLTAVALAGRLRIASLDFQSQLSSYIADDAFYYFKVAANLATTHRITYDGEGLTNGFHPLWLMLITPLYTAAGNGEDFVLRVQWLSLLLQVCSVCLLYVTLLRLRASLWTAFIGSALFAVHSTFIDFQFNGLETALNTLVLFGLFNAFLTVYTTPDLPLRRYLFLGGMAAMAFLVRTDNAIALIVLYAVLLWLLIPRREVSKLIASGLLAAVVVSPWLLWNLHHFGSLIQTSGMVETAIYGKPAFNAVTTLGKLVFAPLHIYNFTAELSRLFVFPAYQDVLSLAILVAWLYCLSVLLASNRSTPQLRAVAVFSLAVFLVFCYHAAFRHFVRSWYYISATTALMFAAYALAVFAEHNHNVLTRRAAHVSLTLWLISALCWHWPGKLAGTVTGDTPHLTVATWIGENTPPDAVIGSMNSGILSYLTPRKVINLDGVMDVRSLQARWDKREATYVHERGIQYLVDNDGALRPFCEENTFHDCVTVFSFGDPNRPNKVVHLLPKRGAAQNKRQP